MKKETTADSAGEGRLIICPTPIGNLGDITVRALEALRSADTVCAEDTRVTAKLLSAYDIHTRIERLDEEALSRHAASIVERVYSGETVVYCSDAGTPGVSDPGLRLVRAAYEKQVPVEVLPGANACTTAYVASGFTHPSFYFGGFLPRKNGERVTLFESLELLDAVLIFYESPKRLCSSLESIAAHFPYRNVAVCRELTKLHEEVFRGLSREVGEEFARRAELQALKGEIVVLIDAPSPDEASHKNEEMQEAAKDRAQYLKDQGILSKKDIVKCLQDEYKITRNSAYEIVIGS